MILEKIKSNYGYTARCKCDNCGKLFYRPYSNAIRVKKNYCNRSCYSMVGENNTHWNKPHSEEVKNNLRGKNNPRWIGGKVDNGYGYIWIYLPNHPQRNDKNYVFEHRVVMEKFLNRYLEPKEVVHHINSNKADNEIKNLMLFKNNSEHLKYHKKLGELISAR